MNKSTGKKEGTMNDFLPSVAQGYEPLAEVLAQALEQAQHGKGKERHACSKPFMRQPMMEIGRMVGSGYMIGQAMKKAQESMRLPVDAAIAECYGAINYLAGNILMLQTSAKAEDTPWSAVPAAWGTCSSGESRRCSHGKQFKQHARNSRSNPPDGYMRDHPFMRS